jgi:hypothetical protein
MTTWGEFLAAIRADLQDASTTPRWSDKVLWIYTCDAIRDYSQFFPRRIDRFPIGNQSGAFPLPPDFVQEIVVEVDNRALKRRQERPGSVFSSSDYPKRYYIQGGNLYLDAPADTVYLTYLAAHPVPSSEQDTTFTFTIPSRDEELIRIYVIGRVHAQMRARQARLDRFDQSAGRRDDNPLIPETNSWFEEYRRKIAERMGSRVIYLYAEEP